LPVADVTDIPRHPTPKRFSATLASERPYGLGEGPLWDEPRERVLWVDINAGHVHSGTLDAGTITPRSQLSFDETVGVAVCAVDGRLLVAGQRDVYSVAPDGHRVVLARVVPADKPSRLNDGACDPAGRFLVGSLADDARRGDECLWQLGPHGCVTTIDDDLTLSNGLGWSPDGTVLYSVDSTPGVVWARPYDAASGRWGTRATIIRIGDGLPDGLCVDTRGNLWIAIWGPGEVRCYTPAGDHLGTVTVPAPHTASVAFVGAQRDTLLITTSRDELTPSQVEAFPLSGHLFTARVEATGIATTPWCG
jgi:sugar lactone lactonase YvrE